MVRAFEAHPPALVRHRFGTGRDHIFALAHVFADRESPSGAACDPNLCPNSPDSTDFFPLIARLLFQSLHDRAVISLSSVEVPPLTA